MPCSLAGGSWNRDARRGKQLVSRKNVYRSHTASEPIHRLLSGQPFSLPPARSPARQTWLDGFCRRSVSIKLRQSDTIMPPSLRPSSSMIRSSRSKAFSKATIFWMSALALVSELSSSRPSTVSGGHRNVHATVTLVPPCRHKFPCSGAHRCEQARAGHPADPPGARRPRGTRGCSPAASWAGSRPAA